MDPVPVSEILELVESYDPAADSSPVLTYARLVRDFPYHDGGLGTLRAIRVADFASMAYCPYQGWHRAVGTPVIRPERVAKAVVKGTAMHATRETTLLEVAARVKPATERQLRDPDIDLIELPEVPGRFSRPPWVYLAKLDGLSREQGHLLVHEMKTGRYTRRPDHLLQVWAYCLAVPGAINRATDGNLRARGLSWALDYPVLGDVWGPYPFTERQLGLLTQAMTAYEATSSRAVAKEPLVLDWAPIAARCSPCGFAHSCNWKAGRDSHPRILESD